MFLGERELAWDTEGLGVDPQTTRQKSIQVEVLQQDSEGKGSQDNMAMTYRPSSASLPHFRKAAPFAFFLEVSAFFMFVAAGLEPRALCMVGRSSTSEPPSALYIGLLWSQGLNPGLFSMLGQCSILMSFLAPWLVVCFVFDF